MPDLTNLLGPGALFVKNGKLMNQKFLCSKKYLRSKVDSLNLDDLLKLNLLNPADTVMTTPRLALLADASNIL